MGVFNNIDFSKIQLPKLDFTPTVIPDMPMIDPEDTMVGQIKKEIREQNSLITQQMTVLSNQNKLLADNYNKLQDLYDIQAQTYRDAQEDLKRSRAFNRWMMIIAIIAMLAAIAGPIVTVLLSR